MQLQELRRLIPKQVQLWTQEDVAVWLQFTHLRNLTPNFKSLDIDGPSLLRLDDQTLNHKVGVISKITRKKIINWITQGLSSFNLFFQNAIVQESDSPSDTPNTSLSQQQTLTLPEQKIFDTDEQEMIGEGTQVFECMEGRKSRDRTGTAGKRRGQKLTIKEVGKPQIFWQINEKGCLIGRHPKNDILVVDSGVGNFHCEIKFEQPHYYLTAMESRVSTWVRVRTKMLLFGKWVFEMGNSQFEIEPSDQKINIRIVAGDYESQSTYEFKKSHGQGRVVIGRKACCDICFPYDSSMSGLHGKVSFLEGKWYFEDMETTNGSWKRLEGSQKITNQFTFKLGATNFIFSCHIQQRKTAKYRIQENVCGGCQQLEKNCLFQPCSHVCCCWSCGEKLSQCSKCGTQISQKVKIFPV